MNKSPLTDNGSAPFQVGDFVVDPGTNRISGLGSDRHVEPKAMQVLCVLASRQGQTVRREELLETVWAGRVVVDETLTRAVSMLRQAFATGSAKSAYIQTIPKQGYRLLAPVSRSAPQPAATETPTDAPSIPPSTPTPRRWTVGLFLGLTAIALGLALVALRPPTEVAPATAKHSATSTSVAPPNQIDSSSPLDAMSLYQQGRYWLMNGTTGKWFYQARDALERAVALDPDFAAAHASLAYVYARHDFHDAYMPSAIAEERAQAAIKRALTLNDAAVDAYLAKAMLATAHGQFTQAQQALDQAQRIEPNNPVVHYIAAEFHLAQNQPEQALEAGQRALALDPLSPWVNVVLGIVHYFRGEPTDALAAIEAAIRIDDEYTWAYLWRAMVLHAEGRLADAVMSMRRCLSLDPASESNAIFMGLLHLELMDEAEAKRWFEQAASLQGDDNTARLWDRMTSLAYRRSDDDLLLALAEGAMATTHTLRFSVAPVVHSALAAEQRTAELGVFLAPLLPEGPEIADTSVQPQDVLIALAMASTRDATKWIPAIDASLQAYPHYHRLRGAEAQRLMLDGNEPAALQSLAAALDEGWLVNSWLIRQSPLFDGVLTSPAYLNIEKRLQAHAQSERERLTAHNLQ